VVTTKGNAGLAASVTGPVVAVGVPPPDLPPVVSIDNVSVGGNCVTLKGSASDPDVLVLPVT